MYVYISSFKILYYITVSAWVNREAFPCIRICLSLIQNIHLFIPITYNSTYTTWYYIYYILKKYEEIKLNIFRVRNFLHVSYDMYPLSAPNECIWWVFLIFTLLLLKSSFFMRWSNWILKPLRIFIQRVDFYARVMFIIELNEVI